MRPSPPVPLLASPRMSCVHFFCCLNHIILLQFVYMSVLISSLSPLRAEPVSHIYPDSSAQLSVWA